MTMEDRKAASGGNMIIGTRTLFVDTPDGEKEVPIRLYMPVPTEPYDPKSPHWECRYEIDWPEGTYGFRLSGNDGLHAMQAALDKIAMDLHVSPYHHDRKLWWMRPWVGYGFGLPKGARDWLIGHDQRYYGEDLPNPYGPP
jgi:hypothetical protein